MHATTILGYTHEGECICLDCASRNHPDRDTDSEYHPIFGESTWEDYPTCADCMKQFYVPCYCAICGEDHPESTHGEPILAISPADRSICELVSDLFSFAQSLVGVEVEDPDDPDDPDDDDTLRYIEGAISDAGYYPVFDDPNNWAIYLPADDSKVLVW